MGSISNEKADAFIKQILSLPSVVTILSVSLGSFPIAKWIAIICSHWLLLTRTFWEKLIDLMPSWVHQFSGRQSDLLTLYLTLIIPIAWKFIPNIIKGKITFISETIGVTNPPEEVENLPGTKGIIASLLLIYLITFDSRSVIGFLRPLISMVFFLASFFIVTAAMDPAEGHHFSSKRVKGNIEAGRIKFILGMIVITILPNTFNWLIAAPGHFLLQSFEYGTDDFSNKYEFSCIFSYLILMMLLVFNILLANRQTFLMMRNVVLIILAVYIYSSFSNFELTVTDYLEQISK